MAVGYPHLGLAVPRGRMADGLLMDLLQERFSSKLGQSQARTPPMFSLISVYITKQAIAIILLWVSVCPIHRRLLPVENCLEWL